MKTPWYYLMGNLHSNVLSYFQMCCSNLEWREVCIALVLVASAARRIPAPRSGSVTESFSSTRLRTARLGRASRDPGNLQAYPKSHTKCHRLCRFKSQAVALSKKQEKGTQPHPQATFPITFGSLTLPRKAVPMTQSLQVSRRATQHCFLSLSLTK